MRAVLWPVVLVAGSAHHERPWWAPRNDGAGGGAYRAQSEGGGSYAERFCEGLAEGARGIGLVSQEGPEVSLCDGAAPLSRHVIGIALGK